MQHGEHVHYLKIQFPKEKNGHLEIYHFFFEYLPVALKQLGENEVFLEIERLESLDSLHTNLGMTLEEIMAIFNTFINSHHLHKKPSLTTEKNRTSLFAEVKVSKLEEILNSYNILFDLFFTNTVIGGKRIGIDMMNGFDNSVLIYSEDKTVLNEFKKIIQGMSSSSAKFENLDSPLPAAKSRYLPRIETREKEMKR